MFEGEFLSVLSRLVSYPRSLFVLVAEEAVDCRVLVFSRRWCLLIVAGAVDDFEFFDDLQALVVVGQLVVGDADLESHRIFDFFDGVECGGDAVSLSHVRVRAEGL